MSHVRRFAAGPLLVAVLMVLLAACSEDGESTGVVFGDGEIPSSVPEDFPVPDSAVVGATLVDYDRNTTEFSMRVPASLQSVARFFDVNLVSRGFVVQASSGDDSSWQTDFRRDGLEGEIIIQAVSDSVSATTVRLNRS